MKAPLLAVLCLFVALSLPAPLVRKSEQPVPPPPPPAAPAPDPAPAVEDDTLDTDIEMVEDPGEGLSERSTPDELPKEEPQQATRIERSLIAPVGPSLCREEGTLTYLFAGKPIGTESYSVSCEDGGTFAVTEKANLEHGETKITTESNVRVASDGALISVTMRGSNNDAPFEQTLTVEGENAQLVTKEGRQEGTVAAGSVLFAGNTFHQLQFVPGRYDRQKKGEQEIQRVSGGPLRVTYAGRSEAAGTKFGAALVPTIYDRYDVIADGVVHSAWFNYRGILTMVIVPSQNVVVIRQGDEDRAQQLFKAYQESR